MFNTLATIRAYSEFFAMSLEREKRHFLLVLEVILSAHFNDLHGVRVQEMDHRGYLRADENWTATAEQGPQTRS